MIIRRLAQFKLQVSLKLKVWQKNSLITQSALGINTIDTNIVLLQRLLGHFHHQMSGYYQTPLRHFHHQMIVYYPLWTYLAAGQMTMMSVHYSCSAGNSNGLYESNL